MFINIAMSKAHSTAGNIFNEPLLAWSTFCRWKWVSMGRLTKAATCADDIPALSTTREKCMERLPARYQNHVLCNRADDALELAG